jgi:hypothetical protein
LVFFDVVLIYRKTLEAHRTHVDQVLYIAYEVECLGHIFNKYGIWVDPKKIESMNEFPHPKTLKSLCRFMGLKRYYCKFVHN